MMMNVGVLDRGLRIAAGIALLVFAWFQTTEWRWIGLAGPVLIVTALVRICPAYWLLRIKSVSPPQSRV